MSRLPFVNSHPCKYSNIRNCRNQPLVVVKKIHVLCIRLARHASKEKWEVEKEKEKKSKVCVDWSFNALHVLIRGNLAAFNSQ